MGEMMDRVVSAIAGELYSDDESWRRAAIAAVKAMREPTEAMLEAGDVNSHPLDRLDASEAWPKMIDEALK